MIECLLLTEAEAAERLRICTRTLRKARQEGALHYVLIGRAVRYTVPDLESFIESLRKVQTTCPPCRSESATSAGDGVTVYKPKGKPHYHYDFQFRGRRYFGSKGCETKRMAEAF